MRYGSFDPKFIGSTIYFTGEQYEFFLRYQQSKPEQTIPLIKEMMDIDEKKANEYISCATSSVHEIRHFFDYYASPLANRMLYARMINSLNCQNIIANAKGKILPIPLSKWAKLSEEEREFHLDMIREIPGELYPFDKLTGIDLKMYQYLLNNQQMLSGLRSPSYQGIYISHIFEILAVCEQATCIMMNFGIRATDLFLSQLPAGYTHAIRLLLGMESSTAILENSILLTTIASWCLAAKLNDKADGVIVRFKFAVEWMNQNKKESIQSSPPQDIWKKLDSSFGQGSTDEWLKKFSVIMEELLESLRGHVQKSDIDHSMQQSINELLDDWTNLMKTFTGCLLGKKNEFLSPGSFTNAMGVYKYEPDLVINLIDRSIKFESKSPYIMPFLWSPEDPTLVKAVYLQNPNFFLHKDKKPKESTVHATTSLLQIGDFLLSPTNRDENDPEMMRRVFSQRGSMLYEII